MLTRRRRSSCLLFVFLFLLVGYLTFPKVEQDDDRLERLYAMRHSREYFALQNERNHNQDVGHAYQHDNGENPINADQNRKEHHEIKEIVEKGEHDDENYYEDDNVDGDSGDYVNPNTFPKDVSDQEDIQRPDIIVQKQDTAPGRSRAGNAGLAFEVGLPRPSADEKALSADAHKARLAIVAYMRTGSSMTGRILESSPDVFYWYEPLHKLERYYVTGGNPSSPYRNKTMNEMFKASAMAGGNVSATLSCDVRHVYNLTLLDGFMNYGKLSTRYYFPCFSRAAELNDQSLWDQCAVNMTNFCRKNFKATAVKTIRLHMARALEVMRKDPKAKIVHLVRDPRGVLLSRNKIGFANFKRLESEAKLLCSKYEEDLDLVPGASDPLKSRYVMVRYEDIAAGPMEYTQQLFEMMGMLPSPEVMASVKAMMTSAKRVRPCPTCKPVPLNSTEVSQAWRRSMPLQDVWTITKQCHRVMRRLGYRTSFRDEAELRDMKTSAVETLQYK